MKSTILILISLLFLTGCMEEKEVSSLQDRGGVKYEINSETPFTGKLVKKYEGGQKEFEWDYTNGELDGRLTYWDKEGNVTKTEEYKDGQKIYEGNFIDGKEEGLWTWWDEEGNVTETETFKDGGLIK